MQPWFIVLYAVIAGSSIAASFLEPFAGIGVLRALPTALLAAAVLPRTRARFGYAVPLAVLCGSAGDFFLASQSRTWFIPGLVAFLIGHGLYLWAFTRDIVHDRSRLIALGVALCGLAALAAPTLLKLVRADEFGMIPPVLVYTAVLGATMAVCLLHRSPTPWIAAGGVIFVVSDGHIAVNHMLLDAPMLPVTLSGYTTYYLAQFLLAHGAARETAASGG